MANTNYNNRKYYLKDKKIDILEKNNRSPEPDGGEWEPKHKNIWAYYRQASADEYNRAGLAGYEVEAIFRINWRRNISVNDRILFRGEKYKIQRIDDFEGYKNDLTIYAYYKK